MQQRKLALYRCVLCRTEDKLVENFQPVSCPFIFGSSSLIGGPRGPDQPATIIKGAKSSKGVPRYGKQNILFLTIIYGKSLVTRTLENLFNKSQKIYGHFESSQNIWIVRLYHLNGSKQCFGA